MLLTYSKNAPVGLKQLAKNLAMHIPGCRLMHRSQRPLERLQALAHRGGESTLLVLIGPGGQIGAKMPQAILRARKKENLQGDNSWRWENNQMLIYEIKFGSKYKEEKGDEPEKIIANSKEGKKLASFFGLEENILCPLYAQHRKISILAKNNFLSIKSGKEKFIEIKYKWAKLC